MVTDRQFFVAGRHSPVLFEAVDEPLHPIPLAVGHAVEARVGRVRRPMGDEIADAAPPEIAPHRRAAVPLVSGQPVGAHPRPTRAVALDRACRQEGRQCDLLMALPAGQREDDWLATALGAEMDLGAEAATAPAEGLRAPFFRAPAACWWARTTVPSTKCKVQSRSPRAFASACTARRMRSQTPLSCQRRKRLYTVCQLPKRSGRSRHGAPVFASQCSALRICRWSRLGRPLQGLIGGSSGSKRAHWSSVSSCLRIPSGYISSTNFANTP